MADYVYSVAIQVNSFQNNMADKMVRRINRGRINEYSLYVMYVHTYVLICTHIILRRYTYVQYIRTYVCIYL